MAVTGPLRYLPRTGFVAASNGTGSFVFAADHPMFLPISIAEPTSFNAFNYIAASADGLEWELGRGNWDEGTLTLTRESDWIVTISGFGTPFNFTLAPLVQIGAGSAWDDEKWIPDLSSLPVDGDTAFIVGHNSGGFFNTQVSFDGVSSENLITITGSTTFVSVVSGVSWIITNDPGVVTDIAIGSGPLLQQIGQRKTIVYSDQSGVPGTLSVQLFYITEWLDGTPITSITFDATNQYLCIEAIDLSHWALVRTNATVV